MNSMVIFAMLVWWLDDYCTLSADIYGHWGNLWDDHLMDKSRPWMGKLLPKKRQTTSRLGPPHAYTKDIIQMDWTSQQSKMVHKIVPKMSKVAQKSPK